MILQNEEKKAVEEVNKISREVEEFKDKLQRLVFEQKSVFGRKEQVII